MLIILILIIALQCKCISKHHIVHFKLTQLHCNYFVNKVKISRMVVARDCGKKGKARSCLVSIEIQFYRMKIFWRTIA